MVTMPKTGGLRQKKLHFQPTASSKAGAEFLTETRCCQNHMLGDSILTALDKMEQTDQHQHSDGFLQEFYTLTQKHNEPVGKYAVRLDVAAGLAPISRSLRRYP